jgi:chaperonin cofactor prefoldin
MDRDNVWEKIKKNFKDGAALSIDKIEEYSKIGKLKIEEFAAKKKIERNCIDIGERVFDLVDTDAQARPADVAGDLLVKKAIENIRQLNGELAEIEKKIKTVSDDAKKSKSRVPDGSDMEGV